MRSKNTRAAMDLRLVGGEPIQFSKTTSKGSRGLNKPCFDGVRLRVGGALTLRLSADAVQRWLVGFAACLRVIVA